MLVDAGGGAFVRFGEAGADFNELDNIAISHFHTDHSADLVTLLKSGYFSGRARPLGISGPGAGGPFPALDSYLASTIGSGGAYAYLSGYLDGSGGLARLVPVTLDATSRETLPVSGNARDEIQITAHGVPHGVVPSIAYRVRIGTKEIVFASDQNGDDPEFARFARNADILVMHMAVPENADAASRLLHAPPSRIGQIAAAARADRLVLSHFMARSLRDLDTNIGLVRSFFVGEIVIAEDLICIRVAEKLNPGPGGRATRGGSN